MISRKQKLTQGQPTAEMRVVVQRVSTSPPVDESSFDGSSEEHSSSSLNNPASTIDVVDPHAVAKRVYELMRQELMIVQERRGWRRKI